MPPDAHQQSPLPSPGSWLPISPWHVLLKLPLCPWVYDSFSGLYFTLPEHLKGAASRPSIHKLFPVTVSSHPARNPAITRLTKLAGKQPQHLQAGDWQKDPARPPPPREKGPDAPASRPSPLASLRRPETPGGPRPPPCRAGPCPLRPPGPRRRHLPPRDEASRAGERPRPAPPAAPGPGSAPGPGVFRQGSAREPGGVGAAEGGLRPRSPLRRVPPVLRGERGR